MDLHSDQYYCSGVATIEATEAAASVKMLNSRPEFWHPGFLATQTLLDSITIPHIMAVVLSGAGAHGDTVLDHFTAI